MKRHRSWRSTKIRQLVRLVRESHAHPLIGQPMLPPKAGPGETAITFIGHSSFLLQARDLGVLVDPVFAKRLVILRRQRRPGVRVRDLPRIGAVLLTHAHMDHLNRPSLRAVCREMRRRGEPAPVAVVPNGVSDLVRDLGFSEVTELRWWEGTSLGPLTLTATPCQHWGARMFKDTHRGFCGYAIQAEDMPTLYHAGDTAYFSGFHEIANRLRPEIALLPIGAYFPDSYRAVHTSPEEALQAFVDLRAGTMIPMHFNTFRLGREPMSEPLPRLLAAAGKRGIRDMVKALGEGESLVLPEGASESRGASLRHSGMVSRV